LPKLNPQKIEKPDKQMKNSHREKIWFETEEVYKHKQEKKTFFAPDKNSGLGIKVIKTII